MPSKVFRGASGSGSASAYYLEFTPSTSVTNFSNSSFTNLGNVTAQNLVLKTGSYTCLMSVNGCFISGATAHVLPQVQLVVGSTNVTFGRTDIYTSSAGRYTLSGQQNFSISETGTFSCIPQWKILASGGVHNAPTDSIFAFTIIKLAV